MNRRKMIATFVALFAAVGIFYFVFSGSGGAAVQNSPTATVRRMDLEDVVTSLGKLEPASYVDVGAQISGQLMTLHVDLGSVVKKGDLLAEIDPRTHQARLDADKATLANLQASLAERQAKLEQARRNYNRDLQLRKQKAASELALQTSETEFKVAQAQVQAIEAQIRQARATIESDELNLSYCRIYAPMSGTVVSLPVREGQTINSSQTAPTLMRIAELEVMTVWASVSEADIAKLRPGMDVYFTTIGDTSTRYYAKVDKIHPSYTEENDVILYDVVFDVENPDGAFLPAMNTQVFFVRAQARDVLGLPMDILQSGQKIAERAVLNVLRPDGKEEKREVALGMRTRIAVEVLEGLNEGEVVRSAQAAPSKALAQSGAARQGGGRPPMGGMGRL